MEEITSESLIRQDFAKTYMPDLQQVVSDMFGYVPTRMYIVGSAEYGYADSVSDLDWVVEVPPVVSGTDFERMREKQRECIDLFLTKVDQKPSFDIDLHFERIPDNVE